MRRSGFSAASHLSLSPIWSSSAQTKASLLVAARGRRVGNFLGSERAKEGAPLCNSNLKFHRYLLLVRGVEGAHAEGR